MTTATISWLETNGAPASATWRSGSGLNVPKKVVIADDQMPADVAYHHALAGTALLWRGDFQNARQLLQAMARRIDHKPARTSRAKAVKAAKAPPTPLESFHLHRLAQSQRARTLGMLLIAFDADYAIALRRAPDVQLACNEAWGRFEAPFVASLRELLGVIGAHEWRRNGVPIAALDAKIHPWYGVFSPIRGEYVQMVMDAPLPAGAENESFDIGTGTGVLAAVLAKRGVNKVIATDMDPRALGCARENMERLDLARHVDIIQADLFPQGRAALVVCNPPWLPGKPSSAIEAAVYDPDSRMLKAFLAGLATHLLPGGEGWLILSDFAEHLGLRTREQLLQWIAAAGLSVIDRIDTRPVHPRASDATDPLHGARAAEMTSLWRLQAN
ncbi:class I SAM-dependent methyltransferase [Massilia sp. S19_KUP03_FR1]|uniref:class I SAM-dependent methyltransferase n=1 Tax=Massilia sp. S19_KUP03_FR1 TaxID=3025503 RepID=UPI002FCDC264